jgi:hypothetical protein
MQVEKAQTLLEKPKFQVSQRCLHYLPDKELNCFFVEEDASLGSVIFDLRSDFIYR